MLLNLFGFEKLKKCNTCNEIKTIKNFSFYKSYGFYHECKNCKNTRGKKYYHSNKNMISLYYKNYYSRNKKTINEKRKNILNKKLKTDNLFLIKHRTRQAISDGFFRLKKYKKLKTNKILGADWNTIKKHIENQFTDNMSWDNFDQIHIDHKIPLAAASTEFEVIALNHYTNLQPLWAEDNLKKSDKYDPEDFKKYMDWYSKNVKSDLD